MGEPSRDQDCQGSTEAFPRPDFRQSFVQTLLAAALFTVGATLSGALEDSNSSGMWFGIATALSALMVYSWSITFRRWPYWAGQPEGLRSAMARKAGLDRSRAISHGLMSLLSIALSSFSLLGLSIIPQGEETLVDWVVFVLSVLVIALASAVAARVARDLVLQHRHRLRR